MYKIKSEGGMELEFVLKWKTYVIFTHVYKNQRFFDGYVCGYWELILVCMQFNQSKNKLFTHVIPSLFAQKSNLKFAIVLIG